MSSNVCPHISISLSYISISKRPSPAKIGVKDAKNKTKRFPKIATAHRTQDKAPTVRYVVVEKFVNLINSEHDIT